MELKAQVKEELLKQKEEKNKKEKEINSKLTEVILFTTPNDPLSKQYADMFTEQGIKFEEKNINNNRIVTYTTQTAKTPIIKTNDNYLVYSRDFTSPNQLIQILRHLASPDYISPPFEERMLETLKNISFGLNKSINNLNRQIQPLVKLMSEITKEIKEEEKNAQKNK